MPAVAGILILLIDWLIDYFHYERQTVDEEHNALKYHKC